MQRGIEPPLIFLVLLFFHQLAVRSFFRHKLFSRGWNDAIRGHTLRYDAVPRIIGAWRFTDAYWPWTRAAAAWGWLFLIRWAPRRKGFKLCNAKTSVLTLAVWSASSANMRS